jgi:cytochrome oxidase Cu insertion factor (SCO1/SenC/PrrC family)
VIVVSLVLIVGLAIFAHNQLAHSQATVALRGTDLGMQAAPVFALTDQAGRTVSLSALRGHPVVLTFLTTTCAGACAQTAQKLRVAAHTLGARAQDVDWLAVSTDPVGDTAAAAASFVATHQMTGLMHFLVGTPAQLQPVWAEYGIATAQPPAGGSASSATMQTPGVYVIDAQGRERVFLDRALDAATLSADLRALLGG